MAAIIQHPANDLKPPAFYVATNGNDSWSGNLPSPNWRKTDGPLASLPRALTAVRAWRSQHAGLAHQPATVSVRGGSYFLESPLVLMPQDSDLILAAYGEERPVVSAGRRIVGWKKLNDRNIWTADIPAAREGKWNFRELWVNGVRAVRARHPNTGCLNIEGLIDSSPEWTRGQTRFRFREGDLKNWATVTNAEAVVMSRWVESRLPILSVDESTRAVGFAKRSVFEIVPGDHYYVEGAFELMDAPGEWYLDPGAGTLYYMPRPGESLKQLEVIAPVSAQIVRMEVEPDKARFVEHVTFRGLTFSHSEWYFPEGFPASKNKPEVSPPPQPEAGGFAQAAIGVPGAVWGEGVRECVFEHCAFLHLGDYAMELARGCQSNRISKCEFSDLGAGGVKIGETSIRDKSSDTTRSNTIEDCHVHDGGKLFPSAIGIWIGQSADNRITHNLIHDFYYTGISVGWTWGYGAALATNNLVAFNHVHHIGIKSNGDGPILSDMGGIYTLGRQPGTVIVNNLWHDIAAVRYGGWGIYLDEGSSGVLVASNLVYRTTHGGFHQHYGETNLIRNNIFALARDHQIQRTRPEPHISFSFQTNIVYFDSGKLLEGDWSDDHYEMDWNLYFDSRADAKPGELRLGPGTWDKWRERGHDQNSLLSNPLFVSPEQNDFRLKINSPAERIGFQPIDLGSVGIRH
jgi:hypothetical protein